MHIQVLNSCYENSSTNDRRNYLEWAIERYGKKEFHPFVVEKVLNREEQKFFILNLQNLKKWLPEQGIKIISATCNFHVSILKNRSQGPITGMSPSRHREEPY